MGLGVEGLVMKCSEAEAWGWSQAAGLGVLGAKENEIVGGGGKDGEA